MRAGNGQTSNCQNSYAFSTDGGCKRSHLPDYFPGREVGNVRGYYASTDGGNTWTQINDSHHNWYHSGYVITGDPNRVGRVYIGTNGRGIIYGDGTP